MKPIGYTPLPEEERNFRYICPTHRAYMPWFASVTLPGQVGEDIYRCPICDYEQRELKFQEAPATKWEQLKLF